ncbi:glycosyltransferase [Plantactinospora sp. CA-294935]|uniref:glycosyltransferase n=1 Tax=Plantactinospora sp. CA-294935 TaxID=3240012 RepID=UPI003D89B1EE
MISFVICARDERPDVLRRTVDGLRATSPGREREIVVVDDGSVEPVGSLGPGVEIVRNTVPAGVSRARRQGFALAGGDVLVCLDAHMTFDRNWLSLMLDHVDSGALLCASFWDYERTVGGFYGADFEWCGERDYAAGRSPGFRPRHRVRHPGPGAAEVPMVLGACYMILRSGYHTLGGFSPLFRVWGADEQDLSARAWLAGLGARCVADARVGHLSRKTFPYPVYYDHVEFNQLAFLRSVFEHRTVEVLQRPFEPLSDPVRTWLAEAGIGQWRTVVQRARRLTDRELFARIMPGVTMPLQHR